MRIDTCIYCSKKGDLEKCLAMDCWPHNMWFAQAQGQRIAELEAERDRWKAKCADADGRLEKVGELLAAAEAKLARMTADLEEIKMYAGQPIECMNNVEEAFGHIVWYADHALTDVPAKGGAE